MPALNGAELCKMIKGHHATEKIRVVLHSTMPQSELEALVRTTGADGYIQKTDDPDALTREIFRSMNSTARP
jgi:CheY-like chemotaxis protein